MCYPILFLHIYDIRLTKYYETLNALWIASPDGSRHFLKASCHCAATSVEHAIEDWNRTVWSASLTCENIFEKILR